MLPVGLLLAAGFMPVETSVQVGPPVPHLERSGAKQAHWSAVRTGELRHRFGRWHVRWDERNGTPRALIGGGLPVEEADALALEVARMAGVRPADLVYDRTVDRGTKHSVIFKQLWRGVPIEGGGVEVHGRAGSIHLVTANLHRPRGLGEPLSGQIVLPIDDQGVLSYHLVTRVDESDRVVYVDAAGQEVSSYSTVYHLDLETEQRTIDDPLIVVPARQVTVQTAKDEEVTGDDGSHGLPAPVNVLLTGPLISLFDKDTPARANLVDDELLDWDVDIHPASSSVLHHFYVVRDWLEALRPDHPWLPDNVRATVNIDGNCNAYYTNGTINFYSEGGGCENFGRIADVIYHEYGHGLHTYIIESGVFAGDISEGSSDFVSATILDDPVLSPGAFGGSTYIREMETDKFWPDDVVDQVHSDGLIYASFLWNLRAEWMTDFGEVDGLEMTNLLFLETLSYGPTYTDMAEFVLASDDDDGDLTNGTPNDCSLIELMNYHGFGPGNMGYVTMEHDPIQSASSFDPSYPADWSIDVVDFDCGEMGIDPDSPVLFYAVDPPPGATLDDLVFQGIPASGDGTDFTVEIPRQRAGSEIVYYIAWSSIDHTDMDASHGGSADGLYRFFVGDREVLWCDEFEDDWGEWTHGPGLPWTDKEDLDERWESEWQIGEPFGQDYAPVAAYSGANLLGTALGENGEYMSRNLQYAMSPAVALEGADPTLLLLETQRFLTVEDALYDQASIYAVVDDEEEGTLIWENPATDGGDAHLIDTDWTLFSLDLSHWYDPEDAAQLAFSLDSDGGLEFAGWHLDDLCFVTLADVPGHYRVRDLAVEESPVGGLRLTWTNPWIEPLAQTVLVRGDGAIPTGPEDGTAIFTDEAPAWGTEASFDDVEASTEDDQFYAVFVARDASVWFDDVVEGENAVTWTGVPSASEDTGSDDDDDDNDDDDDGDELDSAVELGGAGCGCATPASPAAGWVGLLAVLGIVRRRR